MARFLIEVPHENTEEACNNAIAVFRATGSHFVTNAEWGCHDNDHRAWMLVDVDSKQDAVAILPPAFRGAAKVTAVERLSPADLSPTAKDHNS
jgi:hypothetical protein